MGALLRASRSSLLRLITAAASPGTSESSPGVLRAYQAALPLLSASHTAPHITAPHQSLRTWWWRQQGCTARVFATSAEPPEPAQTAELNPLLQTPAPGPSSSGGGQQPGDRIPTASVRARHRDRAPGTAHAVLRKIPISPKKLAMWTDVVRRHHLADALLQCQMSPKKSAKICLKVLRSAQANAVHNYGLDGSRLLVGEHPDLRAYLIHVGKGTHMKRTWPHGRGRAGIRRSYRSHLTVVLKETEGQPRSMFQDPLLVRPRKYDVHHA